MMHALTYKLLWKNTVTDGQAEVIHFDFECSYLIYRHNQNMCQHQEACVNIHKFMTMTKCPGF